MRALFGLILVAGLGLAGFAVYMAQNYIGAYQSALDQERARAQEAVPTAPAWVAVKPIAQGERITKDVVALAPWPKKTLPTDHFDIETRPLFVQGEEPRVALRDIDQYDAVREVRVSEPGGDAGLTSRLSRGERAFAIKVDVASGVSGFLRPGDRVDVYWTGRTPAASGGSRGEVTRLIDTGVRLIAIDQTAQTDNSEANIARTVTVAATPQQVASLAQAQSSGRLSLSLMSRQDDTVADVIEVDQMSLLGIEMEEAPAAAPRQEVCTIRTRKGSNVIEIPIPCTN